MQKRDALVAARSAKQMTQNNLAEIVGISRAFLANIERGKHVPSLKVALKIADVLEVDVQELFSDINVRKSHTA